jgi:HSP20 family protein
MASELHGIPQGAIYMAKPEMKTNEQQDQQPQGQEVTRSSEGQQRGLTRGSGFDPLGLILAPGDFFRVTPFSLMRRMTEEIDRVLHEYALGGGNGGKLVWAPAIEIVERDGNLEVRAELPGLHPSDVKVEVTDEAIILQGERKVERDETKGGVHLTERHYGNFYRSIPLPEGADSEKARARFENGVLELTVPIRQQQKKSREIPIETRSPSSAGTSEKAA